MSGHPQPMLRTVLRLRWLLESIPYDALALAARAAVFIVFWRSGSQKLLDWPATLTLFANEYRVPVLPSALAAVLATSIELGGAVQVLTGLFTRLAVLAMAGMVGVIQLFVYPDAWPDHLLWFAIMLPLIARGPGRLSLDELIFRKLIKPHTQVSPQRK